MNANLPSTIQARLARPFDPAELYSEIKSAWTYRNLSREDFDQAVDFVATGGYALRSYERYAKLKSTNDELEAVNAKANPLTEVADTVLSLRDNESLVVLRTRPGMASAVALAILTFLGFPSLTLGAILVSAVSAGAASTSNSVSRQVPRDERPGPPSGRFGSFSSSAMAGSPKTDWMVDKSSSHRSKEFCYMEVSLRKGRFP